MRPDLEPVPEEPQKPGASPFLAEFEREVARRRTFAIISHPDAGKTTLTEKLLLYADQCNGGHTTLSEMNFPASWSNRAFDRVACAHDC